MVAVLSELRLRSKLHPDALEKMVGKILTDNEYDTLLTGPCRILKPDGKPLAVYLPGALPADVLESTYGTLHSLKAMETDNRGLASGTKRVHDGSRTRSKLVASSIVGAFDPSPRFNYCRLTAWTAKEIEKYGALTPLFQSVAGHFAEHVPDRYAVQMGYVGKTHPDWIIADTPFTTITVNNTYPTGVHTDAGDLEAGFSTLAVLRRGNYVGGRLVFPEYRVAADMQHGDVLLMDAHEWHGNTAMTLLDPGCDWCEKPAKWEVDLDRPGIGKQVTRPACDEHLNMVKSKNVMVGERRPVVEAERISVVCYYRTKMVECGSSDDEAVKAVAHAEKKSGGLVDEMAAEAAMVRTAGA